MDEHRAWGWIIVNHGKYRAIRTEEDRREQNKLAQQRFRERVSKSKHTSAQSAQAEAKAEVEARTSTPFAPAAKRRAPKSTGITFDMNSGSFTGISEGQELHWQDAYPAIPIPPAIAQAAAWVKANPANRKSNYERFLVNWFKREQDKAGRVRK